MKKVLTIIGARPQFIKASVVSAEIKKHSALAEMILHTGQHFDEKMSSVFFDELGIPLPDIQLNVSGGSHGEMTGAMLIEIDRVIHNEKPDAVLVYGDTNSTLAGALAASKLHVPVIHIEAGLRSFNNKMPEEINRILTDRISDFLFCPTDTAVENLNNEGFHSRNVIIEKVGDVMQDAFHFFSEKSIKPARVDLPQRFALCTIHRAENTDYSLRLRELITALNAVHKDMIEVVMPMHPRTRAALKHIPVEIEFQVIEPVGFFEMLYLLKNCGIVLTDSGGLQKEAYFAQVPCVTLRDETEWVELVKAGANRLTGADSQKIIEATRSMLQQNIVFDDSLFGGGRAAERIVNMLGRKFTGGL